jgi:hypothetical protein
MATQIIDRAAAVRLIHLSLCWLDQQIMARMAT